MLVHHQYLDEDKLAQIAKLLEEPYTDSSVPYLLHVELVTSYNLSVHKDDLPAILYILDENLIDDLHKLCKFCEEHKFYVTVLFGNDEILEIDSFGRVRKLDPAYVDKPFLRELFYLVKGLPGKRLSVAKRLIEGEDYVVKVEVVDQFANIAFRWCYPSSTLLRLLRMEVELYEVS